MRKPGLPSDMLFSPLRTQAELCTGCRRLGWSQLCPALCILHTRQTHFQGCDFLGASVPLAARVFSSCWKSLHPTDVVLSFALSKTQPGQEQPAQGNLKPHLTATFSSPSVIRVSVGMYVFSRGKIQSMT